MAKTGKKTAKPAGKTGRGGMKEPKANGSKARKHGLRVPESTKARLPKPKPTLQSETARLKRQLKAARMQQEASAEILRAVANASGDAVGPLRLIAETTARLFAASSVSIQLAEGNAFTQEHRIGTIAKRVGSASPRSSIKVGGRNLPGTVVAENRQIHIPDLEHLDPSMSDFPGLPHARAGGARTVCGTPLRRENEAIGALLVFRDRLRPFTDDELALLQSFADKAVIAIRNARLFNETKEALERQTATSEVLAVISRSPSDLNPVLQAISDTAARLCGSEQTMFFRYDGSVFRILASWNFPPEVHEMLERRPLMPGHPSAIGRAGASLKPVCIPDVLADPDYGLTGEQSRARYRATLAVPLLREGRLIGALSLNRSEPGAFTEKQIELVATFADQAVIAIENVRLFDEVQAKTADLEESLQQQIATADVLKVISRSAFDLQTVLETLARSAVELSSARRGTVFLRDGDVFRFRAASHPDLIEDWIRFMHDNPQRAGRHSTVGRAIASAQSVCTPDVQADPEIRMPAYLAGIRAVLAVPLLRDGNVEGIMALSRQEPGEFTARQIELVETFADQAVIAISNVNLFRQVQDRTRDLEESLQQQTATSEVLQVISRSVFDLKTVLQTLLESAAGLCDASICILFQSQGGLLHVGASHGATPEFVEYLSNHPHRFDRTTVAGRAAVERRTIHIPDIAADTEYGLPQSIKLGGWQSIIGVPLLRDGEVLGVLDLARPVAGPFTPRQIKLIETFADQAVIAIENARLFDEVQQRTRELAASLDDLRTAQDRLVQTEKLASLGQLTAGIAHEIKNPLNFVNNFSALSVELIDEMTDVFENPTLDEAGRRRELDEIRELLKSNMEKVVQHGKRADSIVRNMLLHSREGSGEQRMVDINALLDESLNLAYHGARAEKPGFNITLQRDLDPDAGAVDLFPQEITRALLNLISNGFYAASKRDADTGEGNFEPVLSAATRNLGSHIDIRIRDNGTGIPPEVKEKMFNPFFTTKPAGEGTGLGLSMTHDIIVKQHGGRIEVDTQPGQFTEFTIVLPRATSPANTRKD